MRILFQGDSITDAFRKPEETNPAFQLGNGYVFLIASRLGRDWPGRGWEFFNRGVSGDTVTKARRRWDADAVALAPDILSLLVGVNDTIHAVQGRPGLSDNEFADTYRTLLISLREIRPRLILLEPFLLRTGQVTAEWQEHLASRRRIVREAAAEFGAVFVALQQIFYDALRLAPAEHWTFDGVHPTHAGFQLIADAWLEAAGPLLRLSESAA